MSEKTCGDCKAFAPDPYNAGIGVCFATVGSGGEEPLYDYGAVYDDHHACDAFEPKEAGR